MDDVRKTVIGKLAFWKQLEEGNNDALILRDEREGLRRHVNSRPFKDAFALSNIDADATSPETE